MREALAWSAVWITASLLFNVGVYFWFGRERALEFLTGYLVEKALSIDNIFVFYVTLSFFAVPAQLQHRVLFWGILGALAMRGVFIAVGAVLLQRVHWLSYVLLPFLVFPVLRLSPRPTHRSSASAFFSPVWSAAQSPRSMNIEVGASSWSRGDGVI